MLLLIYVIALAETTHLQLRAGVNEGKRLQDFF